MKSNKTKFIIIFILVAIIATIFGMGLIGGEKTKSNRGPKNKNQSQNGVITQKVIKETVVTTAPQELTVAPIPTLSLDDEIYLNNLKEEENLAHSKVVESLKAEIAASKTAAAISAANAPSSELTSITGGGKITSTSKVSRLNVGVTETSVNVKESSQQKAKAQQYEIQKAFKGVAIASMNTNEQGTDVWISQNEGIYHVSEGYIFNGLRVKKITENTVVLVHIKTGYEKSFQLTSINIQEKPIKVEDSSTPQKTTTPNSVRAIKLSALNSREGR